MKFILMNLAVNTQDNTFHKIGIDEKFSLIEDCLKALSCKIQKIPMQLFDAILVAPEYFFARCCPETEGLGSRHYEYKDYLKIRCKLSMLSKNYPRILFIPGTVAWKSPIVKGSIERPVSVPSYAPIPAYKAREFNSAAEYNLHMRSIGEITVDDRLIKSWEDYQNEAPDHDLFIAIEKLKSFFASKIGGNALTADQKLKSLATVINTQTSFDSYLIKLREAISELSFARNTAFFYLNGRKVAEYTKHSDYQEDFQRKALDKEKAIAINDNGPSIVDIGGLKIGVEICLDHAYNTLKNFLDNFPSSPKPDIHLILSATVQNNPFIAGIPIRIHSSITSALCKNTNTQLPNKQNIFGFTTTNRIAVFECVSIELSNVMVHQPIPLPRTDHNYANPFLNDPRMPSNSIGSSTTIPPSSMPFAAYNNPFIHDPRYESIPARNSNSIF